MQDERIAAIAADLGIADLPPHEQRALIASFGEAALKAATLAVVKKLPEDKRAEFAKLSEAGEIVALKAFLDQEVPEHDELMRQTVREEVQRFRKLQAV